MAVRYKLLEFRDTTIQSHQHLNELKSVTIDEITKVFTNITIYLLVLLPLLPFSSTLKEVGSF